MYLVEDPSHLEFLPTFLILVSKMVPAVPLLLQEPYLSVP